MIMRKLAAALALSLCLVSGTAFAAETPPEWEAPLKAKMETIVQLQARADALHVQLQGQGDANQALKEQLRAAVLGDAGPQIEALQAQLKAAAEATVGPLKAELAGLEAQLKAAREAGDQAQAMVIRAHMAELKLKIAPEMAKLQPLRDQLAPLKAQVDAKKAQVAAVVAPLEPLAEQQKTLHGLNESLGEQAKAAKSAAEAAMKAGDWAGMLSGLDSVIGLRQQAVGNLEQIGALKTQIGTGLQAALNALK